MTLSRRTLCRSHCVEGIRGQTDKLLDYNLRALRPAYQPENLACSLDRTRQHCVHPTKSCKAAQRALSVKRQLLKPPSFCLATRSSAISTGAWSLRITASRTMSEPKGGESRCLKGLSCGFSLVLASGFVARVSGSVPSRCGFKASKEKGAFRKKHLHAAQFLGAVLEPA